MSAASWKMSRRVRVASWSTTKDGLSLLMPPLVVVGGGTIVVEGVDEDGCDDVDEDVDMDVDAGGGGGELHSAVTPVCVGAGLLENRVSPVKVTMAHDDDGFADHAEQGAHTAGKAEGRRRAG